MPESISQSYRVASEHPCFAGHFPGNPIVPGVVILDYINNLLEQWKPGQRITTIAHTKFHQPLRPDQEFMIQLVEKNHNTIKFECFREHLKLASGVFSIASSR